MWHQGPWQPAGYERIVDPLDTALTVPNDARWALLVAETQAVKFRDDGGTVSITNGMTLKTTDPPLAYHGNLLALRFIAVTAGAVLNVLYYR